jgi:hypothetical protein
MPTMNQYLTEEFPKPITLNLRGTKHSFLNYSKYKEWTEKQKEFFQSIGNPGNILNAFQLRIINQVDQLFNVNNPETYIFKDLANDIKSRIETNFNQFGFFDFASKEGKWLSKLSKQNPDILNGAANYFFQKFSPQHSNNSNDEIGELAAYMFEKNYEPDFEAERLKYDTFYEEICAQKDDFLQKINSLKTEQEAQLDSYKTQSDQWIVQFTSQFDDAKKRFDEEYDRHEQKMKESEEFYEKKLAVKNAVTYWTTKAKEHKTNSWIFGIISGALMISTLISIICIGNYFLGLDLSKGTGAKLLTKTGALQLWVYGFFIISVTLVIWIIRLLVKVFLSNLHQLSDANERATMIMTYLAFEREEEVMKPGDKELILPSIFRTTSHGIIKEDSAPQTPMNIFMGKG